MVDPGEGFVLLCVPETATMAASSPACPGFSLSPVAPHPAPAQSRHGL